MLTGSPATTAATTARRRCAVLGSPIGHSLSPVLHRAAYAELGLDWTYDAIEVTESSLAGFLDSCDRTWAGLSLTMPLKRAVVPLLDELTERARQAGAANTLVWRDGRRVGHNTDVPGAVAALRERYAGPVDTAVVVGGGATAASMLLALADLGCAEATVVVREPARAAETLAAVGRHPTPPRVEVARLGSDAATLRGADVLVSTVPGTAQDAWVLDVAAASAVVFEVVYDPWPTPVAAAASGSGQVLVAGLDLLVHQAVLQLQLMTGSTASPVDLLRSAGSAALAARPGRSQVPGGEGGAGGAGEKR